MVDLFCGSGGMSAGFARAGFKRVVGIDNSQQAMSRYPFECYRADWRAGLAWAVANGATHAHASAPCQTYSISKHTHSNEYPDLIPEVREALIETGLPYVIENVVGAPLDGVTLCGTMFDLTTLDDDGEVLYLKRHRIFETNVRLTEPGPCRCHEYRARGWRVGGVYGGGSQDKYYAQYVRRGGYTPRTALQQQLMGIDWMTNKQLHQAIPPAYAEWIGAQLLAIAPWYDTATEREA